MLLVTIKFFKISLTLRLSAFLRAVPNINCSVHPYKFALAFIKLPLSGLVFYSISRGFVFVPGAFCKRHFLEILEIFSLDMSQISYNLLEKTLLSTSTVFYNIFPQACAEIKIWREFLSEKVSYVCGLSFSF